MDATPQYIAARTGFGRLAFSVLRNNKTVSRHTTMARAVAAADKLNKGNK